MKPFCPTFSTHQPQWPIPFFPSPAKQRIRLVAQQDVQKAQTRPTVAPNGDALTDAIGVQGHDVVELVGHPDELVWITHGFFRVLCFVFLFPFFWGFGDSIFKSHWDRKFLGALKNPCQGENIWSRPVRMKQS